MNERELAGFCRAACYKLANVLREVRDNSIANWGNTPGADTLFLLEEVADGMEEQFSEWEKDLAALETGGE
jgi:hypothetical protein